jgi:hypothetical protein
LNETWGLSVSSSSSIAEEVKVFGKDILSADLIGEETIDGECNTGWASLENDPRGFLGPSCEPITRSDWPWENNCAIISAKRGNRVPKTDID